MGIIFALIFTAVAIVGFIKARNKPKQEKTIMIIASILLITIQVLYISRVLALGGLEFILISAAFAATVIGLTLKKSQK